MSTAIVRELNSIMNEAFELANYYGKEYEEKKMYHTFSDENSYNLEMPMLGVGKDNLKVEAQDGYLVVSAKPSVKSIFVREKELKQTFTLNSDANIDGIEAKLENGILHVKVPKVKPNRKTVTVNVV